MQTAFYLSSSNTDVKSSSIKLEDNALPIISVSDVSTCSTVDLPQQSAPHHPQDPPVVNIECSDSQSEEIVATSGTHSCSNTGNEQKLKPEIDCDDGGGHLVIDCDIDDVTTDHVAASTTTAGRRKRRAIENGGKTGSSRSSSWKKSVVVRCNKIVVKADHCYTTS